VLSGLLRAAGRSGCGAVLAGLAALVIALPAAAKPAVWTVPSLVRVERNAAAASGSAAILEAARGETESFQIVVRADDEDLKEVSIGVGDLRGPGGAVIPARNHVLYREHYVDIRETATPGGKPGFYADVLIPFRDATTGRAPGRAELKAQDVTVPARASQPFWVDIAVPAGATPGGYRGTWWARAGGKRLGGGSVELTVWNVALPATPTLRSSFNQWNDHSLAADQALLAEKVMPLWIDAAGAYKLAGRSAVGAAGLGFWSGADSGTCRMSKPPGADQIAQRAASFPKDLLLYNLTAQDIGACPELVEPLRAWARALHEADVANLVVTPPVPALGDDGSGRPAVDIWVVSPGDYHAAPESVREAIATGTKVWGTTALAEDQDAPAWLLDRPPLGYRLLPGFISQSLGFTGLLYWAVDHWGSDPWDPTYRSADGRAWPGEGILVYPGGPAGVAGVIPSMRLKWIRDGVEDYDLIAAARAAGIPDLEAEIQTVAGRDWAGATGDPAALTAARRRLCEALDAR
jgi:hypothetical protein